VGDGEKAVVTITRRKKPPEQINSLQPSNIKPNSLSLLSSQTHPLLQLEVAPRG
jgi:hypothetical protein